MQRIWIWLVGFVLVASTAFAQFTKPDNDTVFNANQSRLFKTDFDILAAGYKGNGVFYGASVTAQGTPDMTVAVAAGTAYINGTLVIIAAGNVTITAADSANPRIDLVVVNTSGTKSVTAGTAASSPRKPAIPANSIILAEVYVPAGDTAISTAQIVDNRLILSAPGVVNVLSYGAIPNGSTDSTAAIQAAIDAAATPDVHLPVYFPGNGSTASTTCYMLTAPLIVSDSDMRFIGDGLSRGSCIRRNASYKLPLFWVGQDLASDLTYTTGLVSGDGQAVTMVAADQNEAWIDLMEAGEPAQFNGRSAATVELFVKPTAVPGANEEVIASYGQSGDGDSDTAWYIKVTANREWIGLFIINGSACFVTSATNAWSTDTTYHVALVFNGSDVKFFHGTPGNTTTLAGTSSCSGTITQKPWEHVAVGVGVRGAWPHGGSATSSSASAVVDSIRFSKNARYTVAYTAPNAKLSTDSNTLLLENFDDEDARFSVIQSRNGSDGVFATTYLPKKGPQFPTQMANVSFKGLELSPENGVAGIYHIGVVNGVFEDLWIRGGVYGITSPADSYIGIYRRVEFLGNGADARGALTLRASSGLTTVDTCRVRAWPLGIIIDAGSLDLRNTYLHGDYQYYPLVIRDAYSQASVSNASFSTEDTATTTQLASIVAGYSSTLSVQGSTFEMLTTGAAKPIVRVRAANAVSLMGSSFYVQSGASQVVEIISTPNTPVAILGSWKSQSGVPWSTDGNVRVTPAPLAGAPTVSSGFGTSPSIASGSSYAAMRVNVGTGGTASSGVIAMPSPPALTGWNCHVTNITGVAANRADQHTVQTASTTSTVTVQNQTVSTGGALAWTASDIVALTCEPY